MGTVLNGNLDVLQTIVTALAKHNAPGMRRRIFRHIADNHFFPGITRLKIVNDRMGNFSRYDSLPLLWISRMFFMLVLISVFCLFLNDAIADYAEENVKAGIWTSADALTNARKVFQDLLPVGLQTQDNLFYSIKERATGENVGVIWIKILHDRKPYAAYIYDLVIFPAFRKRGYARQVLLAIEGIATDHGAVSIALHVFAHNEVAQRLYRDAGYGISGYAMRKRLDDAAA